MNNRRLKFDENAEKWVEYSVVTAINRLAAQNVTAAFGISVVGRRQDAIFSYDSILSYTTSTIFVSDS